ncbi:MAG: 16S rRNA (guanine(527)-N(7))-methyltransferase RsmG [Pseudomonadota bacterium]|nr:16S rRNA (guanine(527)-N(7))-methyltransferase RsmG [Pseudomonadota bacterium]
MVNKALKQDRDVFLQEIKSLPFTINDDQLALLDTYAEELFKWSGKINLIGPDTRTKIYTRHILDALQLVPYVSHETQILDIGSGAGVPGIILSIMGYKNVTTCDVVNKKIIFQNSFAKKYLKGCDFSARCISIEEIDLENEKRILITSRAFAALLKIFEMTNHLHDRVDQMVLLKGENFNDEILECSKKYQMTYETFPSITKEGAKIIKITQFVKTQ